MIAGFIIAPVGLNDNDALLLHYGSFSLTMAGAWTRHIGPDRCALMDVGERETAINRWAQLKYVPRPCTLKVTQEN